MAGRNTPEVDSINFKVLLFKHVKIELEKEGGKEQASRTFPEKTGPLS